jgi:hypothetical protein
MFGFFKKTAPKPQRVPQITFILDHGCDILVDARTNRPMPTKETVTYVDVSRGQGGRPVLHVEDSRRCEEQFSLRSDGTWRRVGDNRQTLHAATDDAREVMKGLEEAWNRNNRHPEEGQND